MTRRWHLIMGAKCAHMLTNPEPAHLSAITQGGRFRGFAVRRTGRAWRTFAVLDAHWAK